MAKSLYLVILYATELIYRPQAETLVKPSLVSPWLFFETNFSTVGPV